jgi:hypothetical protein
MTIDEEINIPRINKEYYIDRYGKVIKYKGSLSEEIVSMHYRIAEQEFPNTPNPGDFVRKIGHILVGSVYQNPIIDIQPTQAQINKLFDLGLLDSLLVLNGERYVEFK